MTDFSKHEGIPPQDAAPQGPPQGPPQEPPQGPPPPGPGPYTAPGAGSGPFPPPPPPYGHPGPGPGWAGAPGYPPPFPPPPMRPPTGPAMWAHLSALITVLVGSSICCLGWALGWVPPLIIRGNEQNKYDPFIRHHAAQAMNYGITAAVTVLLGGVGYGAGIGGAIWHSEDNGPIALAVAGFGLLALCVLHMLLGIIFCAIASTKANSGQWWRYPRFVALPFLKSEQG